MMTLRIAGRNILRNRRRSLMTGMTISVGAVALLLIGALMSYMTLDFQTATVRRSGHLTVFTTGYFDYGAGNPSAYGIADYDSLLELIRDDPVLKPKVAVATPYQAIFGLAGNYEANVSKAFFGQGVVPADRRRLRLWNDYGSTTSAPNGGPLPDDPEVGLIGSVCPGYWGLCETLKVPRCPPRRPPKARPHRSGRPAGAGLQRSSGRRRTRGRRRPGLRRDLHSGQMPRLDILAATRTARRTSSACSSIMPNSRASRTSTTTSSS
jgi:putative ABC transport system permease protein